VKVGDLIQLKEGYHYLSSFPTGILLIVEEYVDNSRLFPAKIFCAVDGQKAWRQEADLMGSFYNVVHSSKMKHSK